MSTNEHLEMCLIVDYTERFEEEEEEEEEENAMPNVDCRPRKRKLSRSKECEFTVLIHMLRGFKSTFPS